jgi:putative transposase
MPRPSRQFKVGEIYHVLNRGNRRANLFRKDGDFLAFLRVLTQGLERYPVDLLCWCLMHNHWHLVLRPRRTGAISDLMRWVGVTHVRRHHEHHHTRGGGHLYQGRFKSFPVETDRHFLVLCRYVQANPLRAGIVARAEQWQWSSLGYKPRDQVALVTSEWPVDRPAMWVKIVNKPLEQGELERLRTSVNRGRPFGTGRWTILTAKRLGLMNTLRPPGRPRRK